MPKTGTKTMAEALRILGFKVYDFEEQYFYHSEDWLKFLKTGDTTLLQDMYKDVDAITDSPGSFFWEELMGMFPDAKVIHMERKTEEEWVKSLTRQVSNHGKYHWRYWFSSNFRKLKNHLILCGTVTTTGSIQPKYPWQMRGKYPAMYGIRYRQTNARVREVVPHQRLFICTHSDGWEPLCKFLDVPIPNVPYPHRNKGGSITDEVVTKSYIFDPINQDIKCSFVVISILLAIAIYFLHHLYLTIQ